MFSYLDVPYLAWFNSPVFYSFAKQFIYILFNCESIYFYLVIFSYSDLELNEEIYRKNLIIL